MGQPLNEFKLFIENNDRRIRRVGINADYMRRNIENTLGTMKENEARFNKEADQLQKKANEELDQAGKPARLYGKVAVVMKSGDVKPIARCEFFLLPFDLREAYSSIVKEAVRYAGPKPRMWLLPGGSLQEENEYNKKLDDYTQKRIAERFQEARDQGKFVEFRTDFDGSYNVIVPPGAWYICNFSVTIGTSRIVWSVPVTVGAGQVLKLDLENGNAREIW